MTGHANIVFCLLLSHDESMLFSGGSDHSVVIWDPSIGRAQAKLKVHKASVYTLRASFNPQFIYSGGYDQQIVKWDIIRERPIESFRGFYTYLTALVFSRNEETIFSLDAEDSSFIK